MCSKVVEATTTSEPRLIGASRRTTRSTVERGRDTVSVSMYNGGGITTPRRRWAAPTRSARDRGRAGHGQPSFAGPVLVDASGSTATSTSRAPAGRHVDRRASATTPSLRATRAPTLSLATGHRHALGATHRRGRRERLVGERELDHRRDRHDRQGRAGVRLRGLCLSSRSDRLPSPGRCSSRVAAATTRERQRGQHDLRDSTRPPRPWSSRTQRSPGSDDILLTNVGHVSSAPAPRPLRSRWMRAPSPARYEFSGTGERHADRVAARRLAGRVRRPRRPEGSRR